jgi:hypothetical protein
MILALSQGVGFRKTYTEIQGGTQTTHHPDYFINARKHPDREIRSFFRSVRANVPYFPQKHKGNPVSQSRPPTTPAKQIGHISTSEPHPLGKSQNLAGLDIFPSQGVGLKSVLICPICLAGWVGGRLWLTTIVQLYWISPVFL